jgi:hypothetical protein
MAFKITIPRHFAYTFSQKYQNCNQWVIELLATATGALKRSDNPREQAQSWLKDNGYLPTLMEVGSRFLMTTLNQILKSNVIKYQCQLQLKPLLGSNFGRRSV